MSRFIPLIGHEILADWDPIPSYQLSLRRLESYAKLNGMRVSFHPDHFTVLSTPRKDVLENSVQDLERHSAMLNAMGLGMEAKCNIHVGGSYGDKTEGSEAICPEFNALRLPYPERITLENDDKTFNALETLEIAEEVGAPMVLDVHHHAVNTMAKTLPSYGLAFDNVEARARLHPDEGSASAAPKNPCFQPQKRNGARSHADYVEVEPLFAFLNAHSPDDTEAGCHD